MRLRTLWFSNISNTFTVKEKLRRTREILAMKVAATIPLRICYWVTLQEIGYATRNAPNVVACDVSYVLANLRTPKVVA